MRACTGLKTPQFFTLRAPKGSPYCHIIDFGPQFALSWFAMRREAINPDRDKDNQKREVIFKAHEKLCLLPTWNNVYEVSGPALQTWMRRTGSVGAPFFVSHGVQWRNVVLNWIDNIYIFIKFRVFIFFSSMVVVAYASCAEGSRFNSQVGRIFIYHFIVSLIFSCVIFLLKISTVSWRRKGERSGRSWNRVKRREKKKAKRLISSFAKRNKCTLKSNLKVWLEVQTFPQVALVSHSFEVWL